MIETQIWETDGHSTSRDWLTAALLRLYNWPQNQVVRPLDMKGVRPIFVVGCGHSGTSMLAAVLGRSEQLMLVGYESGAFFPKKSLLTSKEVVRAWLNICLQTRHSGFIEKTPKHVHCLQRIRTVVPGARFLVIARDGRDVMASFMKRGLSPEFAIKRWCIDNEAVLAARDAEDVFFTRYEDVVRQPETEIARICSALEIAYSPTLLESGESGYGWINEGTMGNRAIQTSREIYDGSGKWRSALTEKDLDLFWNKARRLMNSLGYDND